MTVDLDAYVKWVQDARACAACGGCARGQLANENIAPAPPNGSGHRIVPQVGYLGEDFARHRILVLGKNPGGGFAPDPHIYPQQDRINDQASLVRETPFIREQATSAKWKTVYNLRLADVLGVRHTEIAYTNQILCRSVAGNVRDLEDARPDILDEVYDTCFEKRIGPLLDIIKPNHIIVIGKQNAAKRSWTGRFARSLQRHRPGFKANIAGAVYPFGSHIATAQADIAPLRSHLN